MRSVVADPTGGDRRLVEAIALGHEIYALHEAGKDYSERLTRLGVVAGHPIHGFAVHAAFGSVKPETFAKRQLIDWNQLPADLTEAEMLEMIDRICQVDGDEFQMEYWLACLRTSTGDQKISDLIFWPGSYFGDGNDTRMMSSSEILTTALKANGRPR